MNNEISVLPLQCRFRPLFFANDQSRASTQWQTAVSEPRHSGKWLSLSLSKVANSCHWTSTKRQTAVTEPRQSGKQLSLNLDTVANDYHWTSTKWQTVVIEPRHSGKRLSLNLDKVANDYHWTLTQWQTMNLDKVANSCHWTSTQWQTTITEPRHRGKQLSLNFDTVVNDCRASTQRRTTSNELLCNFEPQSKVTSSSYSMYMYR